MMDCTYDTTSEAVIVTAHGKVDESTWEAFGSHLGSAIQRATQENRQVLVINLAGLDYMSSRGLRALTIAKRQADAAGVAITLAAPNEVMREILAISRYDKLFPITDTVEEAS
jgi:anti-sigma B factor antagonist